MGERVCVCCGALGRSGWGVMVAGLGLVLMLEVGILVVMSGSSLWGSFVLSWSWLGGWYGVYLGDVLVVVELEDAVGEVLESGVRGERSGSAASCPWAL